MVAHVTNTSRLATLTALTALVLPVACSPGGGRGPQAEPITVPALEIQPEAIVGFMMSQPAYATLSPTSAQAAREMATALTVALNDAYHGLAGLDPNREFGSHAAMHEQYVAFTQLFADRCADFGQDPVSPVAGLPPNSSVITALPQGVVRLNDSGIYSAADPHLTAIHTVQIVLLAFMNANPSEGQQIRSCAQTVANATLFTLATYSERELEVSVLIR